MDKCYFAGLILSVVFGLQCSTSKTVNNDLSTVQQWSYSNDIRPIMLNSCTPCHFPEKGRKLMLNTYQATRDNINDILYRVQLPVEDKGYMPFKEKRTAWTDEEIKMVKQWVKQGMPE